MNIYTKITLFMLGEEEPLLENEISGFLGLDKKEVKKALKRMVRGGLVVSGRDKKNGRLIMYRVSCPGWWW